MISPRRKALHAALAAVLSLSVLPTLSQKPGGTYEPSVGQAGKDVVWVPTPDDVVQKMLDLVQLGSGERMVDLGSGDGKIAIAAAKRGAIARGIEYNPDLVELSKRNAAKEKVKVDFQQGDIFKSDFSNVDVITLYLLPTLNERLRPTLLDMKPGTRVTSHSFRMGDWEPDETATVSGREAHFWRVPAKIEGEWTSTVGNNPGPRIRIKQNYQKIEGDADWGGRMGPLQNAVVRGPQVSFSIADGNGVMHRFEATADHKGPMLGVVTPEKGGARRLFVANRR